MREASELRNPTEEYYACPVEDNLFEWHFTIRGPPDTEFQGGFYHGRILLPPQYPMQPPNIILLTPNGRFQVNKKICLSISGYHPESWQPSWSIRTALLALIAFMPTEGGSTVGSLDYTKEERHTMARASKKWECSTCGKVADILLNADKGFLPALTEEESSLLQNINLKAEDDPNQKQEVTAVDHDPEKTFSEKLPKTTPIVPRARAAVFRKPTYNESVPRTAADCSNADTMMESETNEDTYQVQSQRSTDSSNRCPIEIYAILFVIALILIRRLFFLE
ncbi:ubiquitin-conjugating enzyme E2 J1-like isoform X2 [Rhynchophorus ferrugineus]